MTNIILYSAEWETLKKRFHCTLLKCLNQEHVQYVLVEMHRDICNMHSGARCMVTRVVRVGYYWPTLRKYAYEYITRCQECQQFRLLHQVALEKLHTITTL